jgi:hypothetical protein
MIGADRYRPEETPKQRRIIALAAAALVAAALPSSAQAGCRGCAVGAGAIGGLAAGALIGSAIANSQPRSTPPCPPGYAELPEYVDGPVCHVEKRQVWVEGYGYRWRRMEACD